MDFYRCSHCGNIIHFIKNTGVPIVCCNEKMEKLVPGSVDASVEKHVPVAKIDEQKVTVEIGSTLHPMLDEHYIEWIILETENGYQKVNLNPDNQPKAEFIVANNKPIAVYEYCNLHGLWKLDLI